MCVCERERAKRRARKRDGERNLENDDGQGGFGIADTYWEAVPIVCSRSSLFFDVSYLLGLLYVRPISLASAVLFIGLIILSKCLGRMHTHTIQTQKYITWLTWKQMQATHLIWLSVPYKLVVYTAANLSSACLRLG